MSVPNGAFLAAKLEVVAVATGWQGLWFKEGAVDDPQCSTGRRCADASLTGTARGTILIEVSKRQKLLADCRNNPKGFPFSQFLTLIKALGFVHDRTSGSHLIFVHPDALVPLVNVQPSKDGMAKPYQVRQVLDLVDTYGLKVQS